MKKVAILAIAAFAFIATAKSTKSDIPFPTCDPCPLVR